MTIRLWLLFLPDYIITICIILCSVLFEQNLYKLRGIFWTGCRWIQWIDAKNGVKYQIPIDLRNNWSRCHLNIETSEWDRGDLVRWVRPTGCSSDSCQQQEILTESRDKKSVNRNCVDVNTFSMMDWLCIHSLILKICNISLFVPIYWTSL